MNQEQRIEYFMSEIARLSNQVVDLQNERDALAAQVEALRDKLSEVVALLDVDGMTAVQWLLDNCPEIESLINIEPEQHLAEIRAQAVIDFHHAWSQQTKVNSLAQFANQYADSIRQEKRNA